MVKGGNNLPSLSQYREGSRFLSNKKFEKTTRSTGNYFGKNGAFVYMGGYSTGKENTCTLL